MTTPTIDASPEVQTRSFSNAESLLHAACSYWLGELSENISAIRGGEDKVVDFPGRPEELRQLALWYADRLADIRRQLAILAEQVRQNSDRHSRGEL